MSIFKKIGAFLKKLFGSAKKEYLKAAVLVTNNLKNVIDSQVTDIITAIIPGTLDDKIVSILREKLPLILAKELAIGKLAEAKTEEEIKEGLLEVSEKFGLLNDEDRAEFLSTVAAKMYIEIHKALEDGKVTFGEAVSLAETAFKLLVKGKSNDEVQALGSDEWDINGDFDGDGIPNGEDNDADGDGIDKATDPDDHRRDIP